MSDERLQKLEHRVGRIEHLLWAVGAVAAVFGLTGALGWNKLLEATNEAATLSDEMTKLRTELLTIAKPILEELAPPIVKRVALAEIKREEPVAYSVFLDRHVSGGPPALVAFEEGQLNIGGMWNGSSVFEAPISGLYVFELIFIRDAFERSGTEDDVYLSVWVNGERQGTAWAGEGDGRRANGIFISARQLERGDRVEVKAESAGNKTRHLRHVRFTGFLLRGVSDGS